MPLSDAHFSVFMGHYSFLITRQGLPAARVEEGMSRVTTEPTRPY